LRFTTRSLQKQSPPILIHSRSKYTRPRVKIRVPGEIIAGPVSCSRLESHFHNTLASDLLLLNYTNNPDPLPPSPTPNDPSDPYAKNRSVPALVKNRPLRPASTPSSADHVTRLERIVIHTMVKEVINQRDAIWSAAMLLKALSGENYHAGGRLSSTGIQILTSKKGAPEFGLRAKMRVAAKVEIKGPKMYEFLGTLVDVVLPRLRDFPGLTLPLPSASPISPSAVSGVVEFGLPPAAMGLWPQVELNLDAYPQSHGLHMHFITNARGRGAQARARSLMSGFQIPFVRA